jgi:twitching motility protein PilI
MTSHSVQDLLRKLTEMDARARAVALNPGAMEVQGNEQAYVAFAVCGMRFLALLGDLREIIYVPSAITPVPRVHQWIRGVANVRGSLLPIVDLQRFLCGNRQETSPESRVLIVNREDLFVGLQVPSVFGLRRVPPEAVDRTLAPDTGEIRKFVDSACTLESENWPVFSIEALACNPDFRVTSY